MARPVRVGQPEASAISTSISTAPAKAANRCDVGPAAALHVVGQIRHRALGQLRDLLSGRPVESHGISNEDRLATPSATDCHGSQAISTDLGLILARHVRDLGLVTMPDDHLKRRQMPTTSHDRMRIEDLQLTNCFAIQTLRNRRHRQGDIPRASPGKLHSTPLS